MALIDETEAADISSKAKKINQEFWTKEIDKARKNTYWNRHGNKIVPYNK